MDKIFKKRTVSGEKHSPATLKKAPSHASFGEAPRRPKRSDDARYENGSSNGSRLGDKAPSLDMDFRNSLILPGLTQRFSVLLPSLSTAPEASIRDLLASQRDGGGPSLTREEEELLFEELHSPSPGRYLEWGSKSAPAFKSDWTFDASKARYAERNGTTESLMTGSSSSPNLLNLDQKNAQSCPSSAPMTISNSSTWPNSPPPTSTSFNSFATFGVANRKAKENGDQPSSPKSPKSYVGGMSFSASGSSIRDGDVMRQKARNFNAGQKGHKPDGSGSSLQSSDSKIPSPISPEKANDYWKTRTDLQPIASSSSSSNTATPKSTLLPRVTVDHSEETESEDVNGSTNAETAGVDPKLGRSKQKRQSLLSGLTPAQVKRISSALSEIQDKLQRDGRSPSMDDRTVEEEEEVLEASPRVERDDNTTGRRRIASDARSEASNHSAVSSAFPFGSSPTGSTLTEIAPSVSGSHSSPPRLSHSPRSHNLAAHVEPDQRPAPPSQPVFSRAAAQAENPEEAARMTPRPILTPSRTRPARHTPSLSITSQDGISPQPVYIPGQPRPVGSMHRSDGSVSSRSGTPTYNTSIDGQSPNTSTSLLPGHARADSTPSPRIPTIAPRTASLARSMSANHSLMSTPSKQAGSLTDSIRSRLVPLTQDTPPSAPSARYRQQNMMFGDETSRLSTSVGHSSPHDIIEENEHETDELDSPRGLGIRSPKMGMPQVQSVTERRSVADSKHDSRDSTPLLSPGSAGMTQRSPTIDSCTVSQEGTIDQSMDSHAVDQANDQILASVGVRSPKLALTRSRSLSSLSSGFMEFDELGWDDIFPGVPSSGDEGEAPMTPWEEMYGPNQSLKNMSGVGEEEMMAVQEMLVRKAKQERQALREDFDESPEIPYSPTAPSSTLPARSTIVLGRPMSPKSHESSRQGTPIPIQSLTSPANIRQLSSNQVPQAKEISSRQSNFIVNPTRNAPPPPQPTAAPTSQPMEQQNSTRSPSETSDEIIFTPLTSGLVRNPSKRVAPENDPEIRRDFEARIAAATAALNRTPSNNNGLKMERKHSRRNGSSAMVISSPQLMSSSSKIPTTPLTSPDYPVTSNSGRSLDKSTSSAGSGGRRSFRKKLAGFKKGLSFSGDGNSPLFHSTSVSNRRLQDPIALNGYSTQTQNGPNNAGGLNDFKFPMNGSQVDQPSGMTKSASHPAMLQAMADHSQSINNSNAGVGVGERRPSGPELDRSISAASATSQTATTSSPAVNTETSLPSVDMPRNGSVKRSGSKTKALLRTLSKGRNNHANLAATPENELETAAKANGIPRASAESDQSRRVVVRRTLLVAKEDNGEITFGTPSGLTDSPDSKYGAMARRPSVKRKPLHLSSEDKELVLGSPSHLRNQSLDSYKSGDGNPATWTKSAAKDGETEGKVETEENAGLGLLQPPSDGLRPGSAASGNAMERKSSGGGSFYDLYDNDAPEEELAEGNEDKSRHTKGRSVRAPSQVVEIMEYADGQVVWSLVDGLRDIDARIASSYPSGHARDGSFDSAQISDHGDVFGPTPGKNGMTAPNGGTPALNFRHRDRGNPSAPRPPTNVYFASSNDVADLIDHLSKDLDSSARGRIDILPSQRSSNRPTADSSPFGYSTTSEQQANGVDSQDDEDDHEDGNDDTLTTVPGQFEDAPSPRKPPPGPIHIPKPGTTASHGRTSSISSSNTNRINAGSANVPAAGFSPKRQQFLKGHRLGGGGGSIGGQSGMSSTNSPAARSFSSSISGASRSVEDRLQSLLDRLKDGGVKQMQGEGEDAGFNVYA